MAKRKHPGLVVKQLLELLSTDGPEVPLFQASDAEGNQFSPVESISEEKFEGEKVIVIWPRHEQVYLD